MAFPNETQFSLDLYNPIFSPAVNSGPNYIQNGSFESGLTSWTQDTDGGNATITQESATPTAHDGTYYCEIYSVNGGDVSGSISQNVNVSAGQRYRLSYWSRTSDTYATMQGRVSVYDVTNALWIITRENTGAFSSAEWQSSSLFFKIPVGCTQVRIYFYQNIDSDSSVYYDLVSLKRLQQPKLAFLEDYGSRINSYNHKITANMGFDSMSFTTTGSLPYLELWLENTLANHVVVSEASSGHIWEGFINEITITVGSFRLTFGPVMDIINRMRIAYNTIDWNTTPPVGGDSVVSHWHDKYKSMERFGILEGIVSGGEGTPSEMFTLMRTLGREMAWAGTEGSFNLGSGGSGGISVDVKCLGYGHLLNKYYFINTFQAGEQNASVKLKRVIDRNPNDIFSYSDETIHENTAQVEIYEDGSKTAYALLKELANLGGPDDHRYIFGVYDDRVVHYTRITDDITYRVKLTDGRIELDSGGVINPWDARPGKWLFVDDILVGKVVDFTRPSEDPRMIFIESVSYSAPYGLNISSGRASTFKQKIERLGVGGI